MARMSRELSLSRGPTDTPLLTETIGENLKRTVERFPTRDALISVQQSYRATYADLWAQSGIVAKALLAAGLRQGDRLGLWSPNRYEWVLVQYAAMRLGVILVNINPAYRAHELQYVLAQSGTSALIAARSFKASDYAAVVREVQPHLPHLTVTSFFDDDWDDFVKRGKRISDVELAAAESNVEAGDAVNLQYTSGTTGFPKGVTLSHRNLLNNGYFIARRLNYSEHDRVCIPVPFFHCFGMVIGNLACTTHGACMVIPSASFEATAALEAVQQERCTSLYGVPTMFISELSLPTFSSFDLSSLRTGVMAGSTCPVEVMRQVQSRMHMTQVQVCYGMTETSPVSTQTTLGTPLEKQVGTVGTVQDHLEVKVIEPESGALQPRGVHGEVCTRGYSVMLGYWNDPEATARAINEDGWMHTGDLGVMDDEGYVAITGRIKDLIIRGGENISPREIEEFLYRHEAIEDAQVIGVPSEKYGEEVMAWVRLRAGHSPTVEALVEFCKQRIAHYKVPKFWKFVTEFPMTVSGKVRKVEMREVSSKELGLKK